MDVSTSAKASRTMSSDSAGDGAGSPSGSKLAARSQGSSLDLPSSSAISASAPCSALRCWKTHAIIASSDAGAIRFSVSDALRSSLPWPDNCCIFRRCDARLLSTAATVVSCGAHALRMASHAWRRRSASGPVSQAVACVSDCPRVPPPSAGMSTTRRCARRSYRADQARDASGTSISTDGSVAGRPASSRRRLQRAAKPSSQRRHRSSKADAGHRASQRANRCSCIPSWPANADTCRWMRGARWSCVSMLCIAVAYTCRSASSARARQQLRSSAPAQRSWSAVAWSSGTPAPSGMQCASACPACTTPAWAWARSVARAGASSPGYKASSRQCSPAAASVGCVMARSASAQQAWGWHPCAGG